MERDQYHEAYSMKAYGLPDLPHRAVPQLVSYGFRRQGDEAARSRISHIERKLTELHVAQERLRPGHQKLAKQAKEVREEAYQLRQESQNGIGEILEDSLRSLGERILTQLGDAIEALDRTATQLDKAAQIWTKTAQEDVMERQDLKLRASVLKKQNMERHLVLSKAQRRKRGNGTFGRISVPLDTTETLDKLQLRHTTRTLADKNKKPGTGYHDKNGESQETKKINAPEKASEHALKIATVSDRLETQTKTPVEQLAETLMERRVLRDSLDFKNLELSVDKTEVLRQAAEHIKLLEEERARLHQERHDLLENLEHLEIEAKIHDLTKYIAYLEEESFNHERKDHDEPNDHLDFDQEQRKAEQANQQELKEYICRGERQHALRMLQLEKAFLEIEYSVSDAEIRMTDQRRELEKNYSRDERLFVEMYHRLRQDHDLWDTGKGNLDISSDGRRDCAPRKETAVNVLRKFMRLQGDLMKKTQILENYIEKVLEGLLGRRMLSDLSRVLQIDMNLERKRLEHLKHPRRFDSSTEGHNLLSWKHGHLFTDYRAFEDVKLYDYLKHDQFRILILIPAPAAYYPIICKMETWTSEMLSTREGVGGKQYAALSYCWDSGIYNGRLYFVPPNHGNSVKESEWGHTARSATQVRIRNNLYRALLRLRQSGRNAQPVALWVDFLCINQTDLEEKTTQLPKMVEIYSRASNVCVWLGESDDDKRSDEAMQFISTIMDFASLDRYAQDPKQARKWYALSELMRDRWFSRRWVVQEIALAKHATVHCGGSKVQWSDFADAASLLISNQRTITSLFEDLSEWREGRKTIGDVATYGASILLEATNNLFRRKPDGDIKKPLKTIEYLTTSLRTFDTGDPRDLIYSLVSIASDTAGDFWSNVSGSSARNRGLDVDYRKPQVVVYKDFTKFCMDMSKSLDIICRPWAMPLTDASSDVLPSWIPLLRNSEFGAPREVYQGRKNGDSLVGPAGYPNYQASGQLVCRANFQPKSQLGTESDSREKADGDDATEVLQKEPGLGISDIQDVLVARGLILAEITEVSPRNTGGVIHRESLMMGGWEGFRRDTHSIPDRIWRTLVADRDESGRVPPSWYQRACLRCLEIADTFNNGDLNVSELLMEKSEMLHKYLMRVRNVTWNRRFFTAESPGLPTSQEGADEGSTPQDAVGSPGEPITQNVESSENSEKKDDKELSLEKSETEDDDIITSREEPQVMPGAWVTEQVVLIKETSQDTSESERGIGETEQAGDHGNSVKQEPKERQDAGPSSDSEPSSPRQKLFGLCPPDTRNGDIVCVLFGCSVPVVMRRKQSTDHCILIGEAYVHGKMDGEAVEDCDVMDDSSDTVEFQIL